MLRSKIIKLCHQHHEPIHFYLGLLSLVITLFPNYSNLSTWLFFLAMLGSILPDADHLLFFYVYGRHTNYAKTVRHHLHHFQFRDFWHYAQNNHKSNHYILSHNLATPIFSLIFYFISTSLSTRVFWLAVFIHFAFDIFEDLLVMGRLNPNWFFRFSKPTA